MTNELNEILYGLDYIANKSRNGGSLELTKNSCKLLYDYITNLQEQLHQASLDIQELTEKDIDCPSWCDKLTNLQQENKRLKDRYERCKKQKIKVENACSNYKYKIDKAIEYIKGNEKEYGSLEDNEKIILDILRGKDNESNR